LTRLYRPDILAETMEKDMRKTQWTTAFRCHELIMAKFHESLDITMNNSDAFGKRLTAFLLASLMMAISFILCYFWISIACYTIIKLAEVTAYLFSYRIVQIAAFFGLVMGCAKIHSLYEKQTEET